MPNLYEIPLETLTGQPTTLAAYAGKVLLIVNVASKCGFTPQYTGLEQLYTRFKDQGFLVLGFPANDFGGQEPGTAAEIAQFCSTEYPVSFPLFAKTVTTGPEKSLLYAELIDEAPAPIANGDTLRERLTSFLASQGLPAPPPPPELLWNFEKFLVGKDGRVIARFATDVAPDDSRLLEAVGSALKA
jgi:glutathione peroxidase